ncbi:MAG: response regulator [Rubrivivax sp.]|nr:MAG: response regulator [Rubrivivax sp.]
MRRQCCPGGRTACRAAEPAQSRVMKASPPPPTSQAATTASLAFLADGGEMGALMRAHDWTTSSLGPPHAWPQPLRAMVRLILNTGHPMYIWWGSEGACLYNDAYRESIGPELHPGSLGRPAREVWEEIWPIIGPQIEQVREGRGATWNVNHLVPITRHGRREDVYWTYSYSPIDDESSPNGIGGVLVVCTETTAQVLATQRTAAERDRLGQLFEQAPNFMTLLSGPHHRFEIANPSYRKLVGGRDVVGKTLVDALPEAVGQGYLALLDGVRASGEAYIAKGAKFIYEASPGEAPVERFVDFVYQPIKGDDGTVTGIFVEGADVTDRELADAAVRANEARYRELSRALAESNQAKDEFLATLAHELRNPLAAIANAMALQRHAGQDPRILESSRDIIDRQVVQMVRLIDDLLDLSRLTRGIVELRRAPLSLVEIVRQALASSRPVVEQAGHRLVASLPEGRDEHCVVVADETRLLQVMSNLITNAAKFTPRGGNVEVTLKCDSGEAVLAVRDDGVGIPPEMLERVFDMFTQVQRSHAAVGGGLGIGLTLVRQLVERHGGSVTAHSAGPGRGSEFIVRLPLAERMQIAPADMQAAGAGLAAAGLRVLVADDNADAAESLSLLLGLTGNEVRIANDGLEAWATAQAFEPHAMLMDIAMPGLSGHEVCRRVRETAWGRSALMIATSGWGQPEMRRQSSEAGFDHHLVKPVDHTAVDALLAARAAGQRHNGG